MSDAPPASAPADGGQQQQTTEPSGDAGDGKDWKVEFEKLQKDARKWEDRAKTNSTAAKELDTLKQQSMSDQEKAVETAKAEARAEAYGEVAGKLVNAEIRAAAADRPVDIDALLEGLDASRFLTDDGEPDTVAIAKWVDRIAPKPETKEPEKPSIPGFPDLGQGARTGNEPLNGDPLLKSVKSTLGIR